MVSHGKWPTIIIYQNYFIIMNHYHHNSYHIMSHLATWQLLYGVGSWCMQQPYPTWKIPQLYIRQRKVREAAALSPPSPHRRTEGRWAPGLLKPWVSVAWIFGTSNLTLATLAAGSMATTSASTSPQQRRWTYMAWEATWSWCLSTTA